jgi:hypothetical protein
VAASVAMTRVFFSICVSSVVFQNFDGRAGAECPCCSYPCNARLYGSTRSYRFWWSCDTNCYDGANVVS